MEEILDINTVPPKPAPPPTKNELNIPLESPSSSKAKTTKNKNTVPFLFQSLNLGTLHQEGNETKDVDNNMEKFLCVTYKLEGLLFFGLEICVGSFLHILMVEPLQFSWSYLYTV